jgi:hypothetical protein
MSQIKRAMENIDDLIVEALEKGANNVNDVVTYVNTFSALKIDEAYADSKLEEYWGELHDNGGEYVLGGAHE